jgi:hypothetical protein
MRQVNTMQPRDTRSLVAAVGQRLQQLPSVFTPLLDALGVPYSAHCCTRSFTPLLAPGAASDEALTLLQTSPLPSDWYLSPYPPIPSPPPLLIHSQVRTSVHAVRGCTRHPLGHRRWTPIAWCSRPCAACCETVSHTPPPADGFVAAAASLVRSGARCDECPVADPSSRVVRSLLCAGLRRQVDGCRWRRLRFRCAGRA